MEVEEVFSGGEDSDFELDENILRELYKADNGSSVKAKQNSIKDELRAKIQQRRISEGQEELKIEFEPPKSYELTPEEREKIEKRKHRNRQSANKSRIRRQRQLEKLLKDEKSISDENQRLRAEVDALKKLKENCEKILKAHVPRCNIKDSTHFGSFTKLLQDTSSANDLTEGNYVNLDRNVHQHKNPSSNVTGIITDAIPSFGSAISPCDSVSGSVTAVLPSYDRVSDRTKSLLPCPSKDNECLFSNAIPNYECFEYTDDQTIKCHSIGQRNLDRGSLRNMSKEQKISMLKAYLKGNQSKPEVQKLIGQISEMTR